MNVTKKIMLENDSDFFSPYSYQMTGLCHTRNVIIK